MQKTRLRIVAVFAATTVGGFAIAQTQSDIAEYRVDGACLSHKKGEVAFYSPDRPTRGGAPLFLVPAPYPTVSKGDAEDRTGFAASYAPVSASTIRKRAELRADPPPGACLEQPYDHGLARLVKDPDSRPKGTGVGGCIMAKSALFLVPQNAEVALRLYCRALPHPISCRGSLFMDNGWEAEILFRMDDLAEWPDITIRAHDFFDDNLQDCGERK